MTKKRYLSYNDIDGMLNTIYRKMAIDNYKPDVVVGLVRGGLIPAVHMSHYFDVPLVAYKYSLRDHPGADDESKLHQVLFDYENVLIVDDICDEGHTLHDVMNQISAMAPHNKNLKIGNVRTAVLQHNLGANLFDPDYAGEEINKTEEPVWIVYPFEY